MVPADAAGRVVGHGQFEAAEISADARPAEFVVERGGPERRLEHDLERRGDASGLGRRDLPRAFVAGNAQVRHREAHQARLRLGAPTRGPLVADLAPGTGGGTGERGNGGRVVVGLDLDQDVDRPWVRAVDARPGLRVPALARRDAFDDRGIVAVSRKHALRIARMGVADHAEQRLRLRLPVDDPLRVEDLVATVLRVRLREHHEFDVGGITPEPGESLEQVVDLVGRERQTEFGIRRLKGTTPCYERDPPQGPCSGGFEQGLRLGRLEHGDFGHPVQDQGRQGLEVLACQRLGRSNAVFDAALDPAHRIQAAHMGDVGGLAGPRGDGARTRQHPEAGRLGEHALACDRRLARTILQKAVETDHLVAAEFARDIHEMQPARLHGRHRTDPGDQACVQPGAAEFGQRGGTARDPHGGHAYLPGPESPEGGAYIGIGNWATLLPS